MALVAISAITFVTLRGQVPSCGLWVWLGAMALIVLLRLYSYMMFKKEALRSDEFYYYLFAVGLVLTALAWGGSVLLIHQAPVAYQIFLVLMIGGLSSGAAVSNGSRVELFLLFIVPSLVPFIMMFYQNDTPISMAVSVSLLVYLVLLILIAKQVSVNINNNFKLSYKNLHLIEQLEQKVDEANSSAEAKSRFLSTMSHEIRTPLNAIIGFIKILKQKEDNPEKKGYLDTIDQSSALLLHILNDILDYSKIEAGKLNISIVNFDPKKSFKQSFELFKQSAKEQELHFNMHMSDTLPGQIKSDEFRINQVISNLLSNAIKFTPKGGSVDLFIDFDLEKHCLKVAVEDEGIGISKEQQNEVLKEFIQADDSLARRYGGTGLGLSISNHILKLLGSKLELKSELERGSRFSFELPVELDEQTIGQKYEAHTAKRFEKQKILVAEDNKTNQMLITLLLEEAHLEPILVANGQEALDAVKEKEYALILMDINMPLMDGVTAMQEIRAWQARKSQIKTPIIALTANASHGDEAHYLEQGFDDYIAKPIDFERLQEVLGRYLA